MASSWSRLLSILAASAMVLGACAGDDDPATSSTTISTTTTPESSESTEPTVVSPPEEANDAVIELRPVSVSEDHRIVDDLDREVILRGANVNSLGEYWQGDPDHDPTIPVSEADWDEMAARGFSAIRLIITWSLVEPERGVFDEDYLDRVDAYVTEAAEHGIYSVIDMHQDAYSAFIATEDPGECEDGTRPGKGWDGAPEWATMTDDLSTCIIDERNSAPAVEAAWNHFYDNTDGIRDEFAAAWDSVAERFAGRPEVAGYDVLNEPEVSRSAAEITPLYEAMLGDTIEAIRTAEAGADFDHVVIIEPAMPAADFSRGIVNPDPARLGVDPTNIVFGPHNYAESISQGIPIEGMSAALANAAEGAGIPLWIGEYGFWNREPATLESIGRYAAEEDARVNGGAWWQWRQGCGDPHSVGWDTPAEGEVVHLNVVGCPGDVDLGPNEEFLSVLGRAAPRFAPGRITELSSDPESGRFMVAASGAPVDQELVVWTPTGPDTHEVAGSGIEDIEEHDVPGGRIVTATVAAPDYDLTITPAA